MVKSKSKPAPPKTVVPRKGKRVRSGEDAERIPASRFKAHCLEILDIVRQERRSLVVTKHGRPVARVVPYEEEEVSVFGCAEGTVTYLGDIIAPIDVAWEADAP